MGRINRPVKTGGTRTYQTEVAAGHTDIIDKEVDDDLDTIYDEFNGNIDGSNININPATKIACSSLDLFQCIINADIKPIAVAGGGLDAANLYGHLPHTAAGVTVHGDSIEPHTIGPGALFTTDVINNALMISRGATCIATPQSIRRSTIFTIGGTLTNINELVWTSRPGGLSGPIIGIATLHTSNFPTNTTVGGSTHPRMELRQDGTSGLADGTLVAAVEIGDIIIVSGTGGTFPPRVPATLILPFFIYGATPGPTYRMQMCVVDTLAGATGTCQHYDSTLAVVELA